MNLHEALAQIAEIRQQVARTETFRGYRAAPVAFSGTLAILAAVVQAWWLDDPVAGIAPYLTLWIFAAVVSLVVTGAAMVLYCRRSDSPLSVPSAKLAVEQFTPSLLAGVALTWAIVARAPEAVWMLPGLWSIVFALGIFASYRLLPKPTFLVGVYYLLAGVGCLSLAQGPHALSPWAMAIPFGIGQLFAAAVLYWTLERPHGD
jgi:hypothetical protein